MLSPTKIAKNKLSIPKKVAIYTFAGGAGAIGGALIGTLAAFTILPKKPGVFIAIGSILGVVGGAIFAKKVIESEYENKK